MKYLILPLIALAGCTQTPRPEGPVPGVECNSNKLSALVGQPETEATAAEAKRLSGANSLRWIKPGMAVTMDFRADRLNLVLDDKGAIVSTHCG